MQFINFFYILYSLINLYFSWSPPRLKSKTAPIFNLYIKKKVHNSSYIFFLFCWRYAYFISLKKSSNYICIFKGCQWTIVNCLPINVSKTIYTNVFILILLIIHFHHFFSSFLLTSHRAPIRFLLSAIWYGDIPAFQSINTENVALKSYLWIKS